YSQTWNAVIVREISFLPDRCFNWVPPTLTAQSLVHDKLAHGNYTTHTIAYRSSPCQPISVVDGTTKSPRWKTNARCCSKYPMHDSRYSMAAIWCCGRIPWLFRVLLVFSWGEGGQRPDGIAHRFFCG